MCNIEWKTIPGYAGYYEISNKGDIRSIDREYKIHSKNQYKSFDSKIDYKGKYLKKQIDKDGYYYVRLSKRGCKHKYFIHQLVLLSFIGECPPGKQVRHLDGNCINNALSNLVYGTAKENADDREIHGHTLRGSKCAHSKITEEIVKLVRDNLANKYLSRKEFCEKFNISIHIYKDIQRNKTWRHVE